MPRSSSDSRLRFAFDLGGQFIGWAVFKINDIGATVGLLACGVRIFDDSRKPRDGRPLNEQRRGPRGARRRRDRFLQRRQRLMQMLIGFGLLPNDPKLRAVLAEIDPYRLRGEALDRPLEAQEIGRILIHLNQRRGFKPNRKRDEDDGIGKGKISAAAERLAAGMTVGGARTYGEFLWKRHRGPGGKSSPRKRQSVRVRREGEGGDANYAFFPTRALLEAEFDAIMAAQRGCHPCLLTEERVDLLRREIFFQRPLKAPRRGKCTFIPSEARLPKALPSAEACIAYEAVNNLRFGVGSRVNTKLSGSQRDEIVGRLLQGRNVTRAKLRSITGSPAEVRFQIASVEVDNLKDYVATSAIKLAAGDVFGSQWHALTLERKDEIVWKLVGDDDDDTVRKWMIAEHGLPVEAARKVLSLSFRPDTGKLGPTANAAVLAQLMMADVPTPSEAVMRAGAARGEAWHYSNIDDPETRTFLPYYAQVLARQVLPGTDAPGDDPLEASHGRMADPTLHRCLRQLQKLVNALIRKHGRPAEVVIEIARDLKLGEKQMFERRKASKRNREVNNASKAELDASGIPITADALLRMRLYEEQRRAGDGVALCPYSLAPIEREHLLSDRIGIDHILPYSRTFDDSPANLVVCFREAIRDKGKLSPYEAFGKCPQWLEIEASARLLPANKRWRFAADATQRFENDERDLTDRQLNEARYISKLARAYLTVVAGKGNVYVTTGQLTAMLRRRWKLNTILRGDNQSVGAPARKAREDHRHHAVDAIVVGAISRPLLNEMSRRAGEYEDEGHDWRIADTVPDEPFPGYAASAGRLVRSIVVSRKPDHGRGGALHDETAYGLVRDDAEAAIIGNLVTRKPLTALSGNEVDSIRDPVLRAELQRHLAKLRDEKGKVRNDEAFKTALKNFANERGRRGREQGVRRVRIGKAQKEFVPIRNRSSAVVYKALIAGENHHIDIVQMRDGSWQAFSATRFEVSQTGWRPVWERQKVGGKLVMRVHKGDVIAVCDAGQTRYMTVHRLSASINMLYLAEHFEGGALGKRHDDQNDVFRWEFAKISGLKDRGARLVHVDIVGQVFVRRSNVG